jgi:uncharacterized protein YjiS (DUF1127 family)
MFLTYLLAGLRTWQKRREAVRHLSEMSDRELHDVGISRAEIRAAVGGQIR